MGDMKDKMKGFMKKLSSSSSSSGSGKFKGQGRVLGSAPSGPPNSVLTRPNQTTASKPNPSPAPSSSSRPSAPKPSSSDQSRSQPVANRKQDSGFDPFDSLVTTRKRSQNGYSLNVVECPICGQPYGSEEEVSMHVESCVNNKVENDSVDDVSQLQDNVPESGNELETLVGKFVSGKPPQGSVDIVLKLLKNIVMEPDNAKFRRIRMSNPKIREAVVEVAGGMELLEFLGFELREESGEMWQVMETPNAEKIASINKAAALLEPGKIEELQKIESLPPASSVDVNEPVEPIKVDRQIRVFFSVPESVAANIVLPASFYNLSLDEVKREADARKKKLAESQLLIPKSYKEKQAKAAKKKYKRTVIRIQFPDGVVLQGVFSPREPTTVLYEFVSSALKEQSLEFELINPGSIKRRVIPHFAAAGKKPATLEEEDLVPSSLIKFKPIETDSVVFTGLCNELLEISEPLVNDSAVRPM